MCTCQRVASLACRSTFNSQSPERLGCAELWVQRLHHNGHVTRRDSRAAEWRISLSRGPNTAALHALLRMQFLFQLGEQHLIFPQQHLSSPPLLVAHGLTATGKSSIIKAYLERSGLPFAIVHSRECITGRHLLERIVAACLDALDTFGGERIDRRPYARTENLSALAVNLGRMFEGREKFVLVLDGVDKQREAPPTLLAALGRLGEIVSTGNPLFQGCRREYRAPLTTPDPHPLPPPHNNPPPHHAPPQTRGPPPPLPDLPALLSPNNHVPPPAKDLPHPALHRALSRLHV